jgi:hypothetical protein
VTPPSRGILPLDDATIDRVAQSYTPIEQEQVLQLGNVQARLPAGSALFPWQQYGLAILNTALGDRPVYFASSGNAASSLGVDSYLVRQGLAFRLPNGDPTELSEGIVGTAGSPYRSVIGDYVDVPRTETLATEVFVHRSGIPDEWSHWPDQSTIGIPNYYAWAHLSLAQAAAQTGQADAMERHQERAEAWTVLGSGN